MKLVTELERLLEEEQRLLLTGDYEQLEALAERKLKLSEVLISAGVSDVSADRMRRLAHAADRNEALLESAKRGIQAAISQLREASEESFQSYSKDGARQPLSRAPSIRQRL